MKIAAAQIKPIKGDISGNIENHKLLIDLAVKNQVDLIIFPELSITGYEPELAKELAIHYEDPVLDDFQKISQKNNIIIGVGMPTKNTNQLLISCILFYPRKKREVYSKQNLYPTEVAFFSAGQHFYQLETEKDKIALAICYDLSDTYHSSEAHRSGSTVYFASVLNSVNGIDSDIVKLSTIAQKSGMQVLMANFTGESGGYLCAGKTSVWNQNGVLTGQLDSQNEGILILDTLTSQVEMHTLST